MGNTQTCIERIQRNDPEYAHTNLDLANRGLTDAHVQEIANALYGNTNLKWLILGGNNIGDEGVKQLSHALKSKEDAAGGNNTTLKALDLDGNKIGDQGLRYLAKALQGNNGLKKLWLGGIFGGNNVTDKGAEYLYEALQENTSLTKIHLDKNPIENKSLIDKINQLMKRNENEPVRARKEAEEHRQEREQKERQNQQQPNATMSEKYSSGGRTGKESQDGASPPSSNKNQSDKLKKGATNDSRKADNEREQQHSTATKDETGTSASGSTDDKSEAGSPGNKRKPTGSSEQYVQLTEDEVEDLRNRILPKTGVAVHRHEIPRALEREDEDKILQYIKTDEKLQPFYSSLNSVVYDYFIAAMSIRTGDVAIDPGSKTKATVTSLLSILLQGIPIASQISSVLHNVIEVYVSVDITRAMNNLLSVAPTHTEIMRLVEQVTRAITLGLKDIHIDKLDSTKSPRGVWKQVKDRIMSKQPTNAYEEEGILFGMAIIKLCMKGDVGSEAFNAQELLYTLGYDRDRVRDSLQRYRSEALRAGINGVEYGNEQVVNKSEKGAPGVQPGPTGEPNVWEELRRLREEVDNKNPDIESLKERLGKLEKTLPKPDEDAVGDSSAQCLKPPGDGTAQSGNDEVRRALKHGLQANSEVEDLKERLAALEARPRSQHFRETFFSFSFALNRMKRVMDEHYGGDSNHAWSRDPNALSILFRRKKSIAQRLQGSDNFRPVQVSGRAIMNFFDSDCGLSNIFPSKIYQAFDFGEEGMTVVIGSSEEAQRNWSRLLGASANRSLEEFL